MSGALVPLGFCATCAKPSLGIWKVQSRRPAGERITKAEANEMIPGRGKRPAEPVRSTASSRTICGTRGEASA
jgi:hypothetical protein